MRRGNAMAPGLVSSLRARFMEPFGLVLQLHLGFCPYSSATKRHQQADTYIGQLELAAASAPYFSPQLAWLRERSIMHYIDNQGACYGLIHGRSANADANRLIFVTNMRIALLKCDAWFDYVPSASNIAHLPTRL